jgi:hypothetical protein
LGEGQISIHQFFFEIDAKEVSEYNFASEVESLGFQVGEELV